MDLSPDSILDEIIERDGDCLRPSLCSECPFYRTCHMRFLDGNPPSRRERVIMALDAIIHREIMADEDVAAGEKASKTIAGSG